jgi:phosphate-selective porin
MKGKSLVGVSVFAAFFHANVSGQTDPASINYFFPDIKQNALVADGKRLWFKPIIAIATDYNLFSQDNVSLEQVGTQENVFDLRAARLGMNLRSKGKLKWAFTFTADYQESRTRDDVYFQIYDLKLDIPVGPVKITLGKQKEPFSYEMVGLMPQLPQQERMLTPFYNTRNTGLQLSGQLAGDHMTWWTGAFNDWLETGTKLNHTATNWFGRLTGLPYVTEDNFNFLHIGIGSSHLGSDNGMMRFSGRPSSNVADKYVDTESFPANHATELSFEAIFSFAPLLVQAEHIEAWVDSPERDYPRFTGTYLSASWVITGESRPYIRKLGYSGGIVPKRRFGAVEIAGRFGYLNLTDEFIEGGIMKHWYFGANWWASRQWKIGVSYGDCNLDKDALTGNTKMLQCRLLWMY